MSDPILIGCEESQTICKAFRDAGYEAYSCDLQPTRGNPEWHLQQDILTVIPTRRWRLIILHPDCTAMAVSGNRWYGTGMPRHDERIAAIAWTLKLWNLAKQYSDRCALENPVSVIFTHLPDVFYLQPHEHGHGETKKTGFALHNLPPLVPTNNVDGREQRVWKMPPSETRKRDRSKTFDGVAKAVVQQWGKIILDSTRVVEYHNHTVTEEANMSKCSVCGESQFKSLLGMNCSKGHLNAPAQPKEKQVTEQAAAPVPLETLQNILDKMRARYNLEREHFDFKTLIDKQSTVLKGIIPQADIDLLVGLYIARRDEKAVLKKQFEAEYALLDGDLESVATELKSRALTAGVEGFKCDAGTVYLSETMKVTGSDWGAFGQFLKTHDPLEFMEKRISSTAIKAYMKESGGELPPGVSIFKEVEARVRRAGEK